MLSFNRKAPVALCCAAALAAALAPSVALAKSRAKISFTCVPSTSKSKSRTPPLGSCHGAPWGSFKDGVNTAALPPVYIFQAKGAVVSFSVKFASKAGKKTITGTWKAVGGSGRYKKIKGSGNVSSPNKPNAAVTFKGTVTY